LSALGINGGLLLAQIVNIALVVFFLSILVWGPLVKALEARREKIAKGLEDARAAEQARANAERDAQKYMDTKRGEANKFIDEGRARGEEQAKSMIEQANRDAEAIRSKARADAEEERNSLLGEVRLQVSQMALAAAEQVIKQSLDATKSQAIINDFFTSAPAQIGALGNEVEVTSALPLSDSEKADLGKKLGAKALTYRVDPSVIGGLILRSGERVVDGSVRNNLQGLGSQIR